MVYFTFFYTSIGIPLEFNFYLLTKCRQQISLMAEQQKYKIAVWNANGLQQHAQELKTFLYDQNIDIIMISETHEIQSISYKTPKRQSPWRNCHRRARQY
jgi:DNA-binding LacI/PurR family transcriptional regulator